MLTNYCGHIEFLYILRNYFPPASLVIYFPLFMRVKAGTKMGQQKPKILVLTAIYK